jgi:hypothetical protein
MSDMDRITLGRRVYDYFVARGLAPHQAAAFAGNWAWEGGGRTDLVNPGDNWRNSPRAPHSIGPGQWNDRSPALVTFARRRGVDIPEGDLRDVGYARDVARRVPLDAYLDFAWDEMQGPEARALRAVSAAPDLRTATAGAIGYHRPAGFTWANPYGGHGFEDRLGLAERILGAGRDVEPAAAATVVASAPAARPLPPATASALTGMPAIPAGIAAEMGAPGAGDAQGGPQDGSRGLQGPGMQGVGRYLAGMLGGAGRGGEADEGQRDVLGSQLQRQQVALTDLTAQLLRPQRYYRDGGRVDGEDARRIAVALRIAARKTDTSPSDAAKESGRYAKGTFSWHGLKIAIENPKGSTRSGVDKGGKRWSVKMPATYGFVRGTEGFDGDAVDVYVGPDHASSKVFVIDQVEADTGKFDEHKCCLSYASKEAALADYRKAFSDGKADRRIGAVTEMGVDAFKAWLKSPAKTGKPAGRIAPRRYADGGSVRPIGISALDVARAYAGYGI